MLTKEELRQQYKVKDNEQGYVHVMFTKIIKDGKRTRDNCSAQVFTIREFDKLKQDIEKLGIGITQFDEYEVLYDPKIEEAKKAKEAKEAAKKEAERIAKEKAAEENRLKKEVEEKAEKERIEKLEALKPEAEKYGVKILKKSDPEEIKKLIEEAKLNKTT